MRVDNAIASARRREGGVGRARLAGVDDWEDWRRPGPAGLFERADVMLTLAVMAGAAAMTVLINSTGLFAPSLGEQLLWDVALTAPLLVRRRFPATVAIWVGAVFIAGQLRHIGDNLVPTITLFIALYSLGAWGRNRVVARWVRLGVIAAMFVHLGVSMARALAEPSLEFEGAAGPLDPVLAAVLYDLGVNALFFVSAYVFGNQAWESARRWHQLEVQGERLRASQAENARRAVMAERVRIARDLHDVVAHHVSVMGVQASAARRVLDSDPTVASEALRAVESTARTAIDELAGLLSVLRSEPDAPAEPSQQPGEPSQQYSSMPGLDQLPRLVDETRATGLTVTYTTYGAPKPVPEAIGLSVYRIVQEALTNTVKHAGARTAEVRLRYLDHAIEVEINDDGRGAAGPSAGAGLGLVGMRERVAVHGGELDVGPRRGGGFQVRARFPLSERTPAAVVG
ncbi:MAG: sensor histidine kinase [Micromonosporaceae bacterium]|nr:sensor histidine kinase [Micromonosporaceae bacterium]